MALAPSSTLGDWSDFTPTSVDNGAWIDLYTTCEHNKIRTGRASSNWTDTYLKQKLTVGSLGYSYDPRFLQYRFTVSGVLSQENFTVVLPEEFRLAAKGAAPNTTRGSLCYPSTSTTWWCSRPGTSRCSGSRPRPNSIK